MWLVLFVCLLSLSATAQDSVILKGTVRANSPDIEKIHVINLNLEKGTTTDEYGAFEIIARENDSIFFSSVQYEKITILVTAGMLNKGTLKVKLSEQMNELAEVMIDDIKLSGYLANDLAKISIKDYEMKSKLMMNLGEAIKWDRKMHPVINPNPGVDIKKLVGIAINKLSKPQGPPIDNSPETLAVKSIEIVGQKFFNETLSLNDTEVNNFLYFCSNDSRFRQLVFTENTFALIEYLQSRIEEFRDVRGALLNKTREIPG